MFGNIRQLASGSQSCGRRHASNSRVLNRGRPSPCARSVRQHCHCADRRWPVGPPWRVRSRAEGKRRRTVDHAETHRISSRTNRSRGCWRCRAWTAGIASVREKQYSSCGMATAPCGRCRRRAPTSDVRSDGTPRTRSFIVPATVASTALTVPCSKPPAAAARCDRRLRIDPADASVLVRL